MVKAFRWLNQAIARRTWSPSPSHPLGRDIRWS